MRKLTLGSVHLTAYVSSTYQLPKWFNDGYRAGNKFSYRNPPDEAIISAAHDLV
jgi:hypothetical protein